MLWDPNPSTDSEAQSFIEEGKKLELNLLPYDIMGSKAHAEMLEDQGYLTEEELKKLLSALDEVLCETESIGAEDVHTEVEEKVTDLTEAGKKLHTGRSRNDQVVLDTRLFMKDSSIAIALKTLELIESLEEFGEEKNEMIPGYTHQQQAMPSSTGLWASSFADSLADDLKMLKSIYQILDQNPLGSAASYGTELEIDREKTAKILGFNSVQENPISSVNRGKMELMLLQCLSQIMMDLGKMGEDLINFSEDQQIFKISEEFCTGSSIMPQKKNPDTLEMIRAKSGEVKAHEDAVFTLIHKLPSGYNKDTQGTKKHLFQAVEESLDSLTLMKNILSGLEVSNNFEMNDEVFAAYTANKLVDEEGMSFREAHHQIRESESYESYSKPGEPSSQSVEQLELFWKEKDEEFQKTKSKLLGSANL